MHEKVLLHFREKLHDYYDMFVCFLLGQWNKLKVDFTKFFKYLDKSDFPMLSVNITEFYTHHFSMKIPWKQIFQKFIAVTYITQSVKKREILSHWKNISWIQLLSNFFS